jgi:uncharacterized protein
MSLQQRFQSDLGPAMKAGDKTRVSTLRMMRAKLQETEIANAAPLTEEKELEALTRYAKQLRESIDGFAQGGRAEQKLHAEAELAIVESYLPKQLGDDELAAIVKETIAEVGATSAKEIGKVMSAVMPKVKGRADGKKINQLVKSALGA